jgi:hypothetical protein
MKVLMEIRSQESAGWMPALLDEYDGLKSWTTWAGLRAGWP